MTVTENITVQSKAREIKRGIIRDFPATYKDNYGNSVKMGSKVLEVQQDGKNVPYHREKVDNGERLYIGDKDIYLPAGIYTYTIKYHTVPQLGNKKEFDELYWNVTGNGWSFPIDAVEVKIEFPTGTTILKLAAYTGNQGDRGKDFTANVHDNTILFKTTRNLKPGEGLTITVAFPKDAAQAQPKENYKELPPPPPMPE